MNAVGGNIKSLRIRARLSREELAKRVGVSVRDASMWERRTAQPDIETLGIIAQALGADINEVIYGRAEADPKKIKRQWAAFIVFGALFILLLVSSYWFKSYVLFLSKTKYMLLPTLIYLGIWRPVLYILAALSALCGLSLLWDFRIRNGALRLTFLLTGIAIILLYCAACVAWVNQRPDAFLPRFAEFMANTTALFLLPALGLYLGIKK